MSSYAKMFGYRPVKFMPRRKAILAARPRRPYRPSNPLPAPPLRMGRRFRIRYGARPGMTQLKRRRNKPQNAIKNSDNSSLSSVTIGIKKYSRFMAQLLRNTHPVTTTSIQASNLVCSQGLQRVFDFAIMNNTDLAAIKTAITTGSATPAAPTKFYLKNAKVRYSFRNQSNVNSRCVIYDMVTKKLGPVTSMDTPVECWQKGYTDYGVSNGEITVGLTPYKSPDFRYHYKILKTTYINLEPGQQHEHVVNHNYHRVVDSVNFESATQASLPGLTRWTLLVFYGHLAHNSVSTSSVTTAPVTIDYMVNRTYTYSVLAPYQPKYSLTNGLPTGIADLDQMGESGDVDNDPISA